MTHNISIPHFFAKLRLEHLYQHDGREGFKDVVVFGAQSIQGRALTFHVLCDDGSMRSRVPIHMLAWKEDATKMPLDHLQLWDCFGNHISATTYEYLDEMRVKTVLKDHSEHWGSYIMTFDWYDNPSSNEPTQYKCAHLIRLDNGNYALQPNNRLMWRDMSFTTKPFPERPDWLVDNKTWICEKTSDSWLVDDKDDNIYYYNIKETKNNKLF